MRKDKGLLVRQTSFYFRYFLFTQFTHFEYWNRNCLSKPADYWFHLYYSRFTSLISYLYSFWNLNNSWNDNGDDSILIFNFPTFWFDSYKNTILSPIKLFSVWQNLLFYIWVSFVCAKICDMNKRVR